MPTPHAPALGPYRLLRPIGRGAMGTVHLAVDRRSGRAVAVKTLPLGGDPAEAERAQWRQRFAAEVEAAQRLAHPDIAAVYAAGEQGDTAWLAMELLRGCELTRYTRAPRLLPEVVVLSLGERLARALAHAHAHGVVHRDLKPGNVMLDLPAGGVKLTDFGVAALVDASRTRTGVVLGTPLYMAPEQLAGASADARSDLYALGVLLYELLAGERPHEHASLGELLRQVAQQPAPDLRALRPELDAEVAVLVGRCLDKRPASRPADAAALADALQRLARRRGAGADGALHNRIASDGYAAPSEPSR